MGHDGNLWFTEGGSEDIGRITPSGTITEFPIPTAHGVPAGVTGGITAGPDGNVWFTEQAANAVGRITPGGTITSFPIPTAASVPDGITAGPDGTLWFAEVYGNKIGRIEPRLLTACVVPKLKGKTLTQAKRLLSSALLHAWKRHQAQEPHAQARRGESEAGCQQGA